MKPAIQTSSGRFVDLLDPDPKDLLIGDIAYSLSHLSRFTGHVGFYSVAEHSVGVAFLTRRFYRRESYRDSAGEDQAFKAGLLHDASEAYLGDVSSPLKSLLPAYRALEERFQSVLAQKFVIYDFDLPGVGDLVRKADLAMLELERQVFFESEPDTRWPGFSPGFEVSLKDLYEESRGRLGDPHGAFGRDPESARRLFLGAWGECEHV